MASVFSLKSAYVEEHPPSAHFPESRPLYALIRTPPFAFVLSVYTNYIHAALMEWYVHAASFRVGIVEFGGWNGMSNHDICASLTHVPSEHWRVYPTECEERIRRQVVGVEVFLLGFLLLSLIFFLPRLCLVLLVHLHMILMWAIHNFKSCVLLIIVCALLFGAYYVLSPFIYLLFELFFLFSSWLRGFIW